MTTGRISAVDAAKVQVMLDQSRPDRDGQRQQDRRRPPERTGRDLVATGKGDSPRSAKPAASPAPPPAAFAAQVLGQPGKKRGLRGGPQVLGEARSTYLSREYSGHHDRRPMPGIRKKTEI